MKKRRIILSGIFIFALFACETITGENADTSTEEAVADVSPTTGPTEAALPATEAPLPPADTPIPPTLEPIAIIRLGPGLFGSPLHLEVIMGDYIISSGATLRAGSSIDVNEDWLIFPPGLEIEIGEGGITLNGQAYPAGTIWIVDAGGNLVER